MKEKKYYYVILKFDEHFLIDRTERVFVLLDEYEKTDKTIAKYESEGYDVFRYPSDRLGHIINRLLKKGLDITMYTAKGQYFTTCDCKLVRIGDYFEYRNEQSRN